MPCIPQDVLSARGLFLSFFSPVSFRAEVPDKDFPHGPASLFHRIWHHIAEDIHPVMNTCPAPLPSLLYQVLRAADQ